MATLLNLGDTRPLPKPAFRWWSRVLVPLAIVLMGGSILLGSAWHSLMPTPSVRVEAAVPKSIDRQAPASVQVQATGWLEASPYLHHVSALTNGVLWKIHILEGDTIKQGELVASLVDDDARLAVESAQAEVAIKTAALGEARARHEAAELTWAHPIAMERSLAVSKAQQLEASAAVAFAEARLREQVPILTQAQRDLKRAEDLAHSKVISKQAEEEALKEVAVAEAAQAALQKALQKAVAEAKRMEAIMRAAQRDLALRIDDQRERSAATAALERSKAEVRAAQARLAEARLRLQRTQIVSPVDGVVVHRWKAPGDKVMLQGDQMRSAVILSLYDPSKLQARVDVPLADAAKIMVGQPCEVISEVLNNQVFKGRVDRILHAADIQKNTLEIKVVLQAPSPALRPEMLCRVRFLADAKAGKTSGEELIFAPASAVREGRIWRLQEYDGEYGVARSMAAQTGVVLDEWVSIDGLHPGDLIITSRAESLSDGTRVRMEDRK